MSHNHGRWSIRERERSIKLGFCQDGSYGREDGQQKRNRYPTNSLIPPIRICSTRIPPIRINAMRIHSIVSIQKVSSRNRKHIPQYISHQYVSSTRIPLVLIHSMRIHSKSLHQQEWRMSIIGYHFIPLLLGGNGDVFFCLMAAWLNEVVVRAVALLSALTKEFTMHNIL